MKQYDVIVIGTGAALTVVEMAAKAGKKVAVIEKGKFGGTCLTRGCIPTKVMVSVADVVRSSETWSTIGLKGASPVIDWQVVTERVWQKINESQQLQARYEKDHDIDVYLGTASFMGDHEVQVKTSDGATVMLTASQIIIGAGARTAVPEIKGLEGTSYWTSERFFGDLFPKELPKSLIVLGGGPIGMEFAHALSAAGVKVTLVQHNRRLLPKEEPEFSAHMKEVFDHFGIDTYLNQEVDEVQEEDDGFTIKISDRETGATKTLQAEKLLVATGITPNTDMLTLNNTHIAFDQRGMIRTNEFLETTVPGVYALGDINGKPPFRHKANYETDIIGNNLFDPQASHIRWARYDLVPVVTYTYPQVAHVGLLEEEARKKGMSIRVARHRYSSTAKGFAIGCEEGSIHDGEVKLIADAQTDRMIGVHIIGPEASILIQPFVNLMNAGTVRREAIEPEIITDSSRQWRKELYEIILDPHVVSTVSETMTPHPSLSEVAMWTRYYYEGKD